MSRYAPGHKQEAKAQILAAVGRGFRKRGYGGIGVDGLAKEADVTSGALYGHFRSKEDAFKEAVVAGIDELAAAIVALRAEHGANWIETFVDFYLGQKRVCDLGESCALRSSYARGSAFRQRNQGNIRNPHGYCRARRCRRTFRCRRNRPHAACLGCSSIYPVG